MPFLLGTGTGNNLSYVWSPTRGLSNANVAKPIVTPTDDITYTLVGYAYDFTTSRLRTVSRGTHEVVVGFLLGNRYGDTCPRNVW